MSSDTMDVGQSSSVYSENPEIYSGIDLEKLSIKYPVDGEKLKSHGNIYQWKFATWYACKGLGMDQFRISCEMKDAGKFDDLIFQYNHDSKCIFKRFQLKHLSDTSKCLTENQLFQYKNDPFALDKYFTSFAKLNKSFEETYNGRTEEIALFTNVDMKFTEIMTEKMFDIGKEDEHKVYKFSRESRDSNITKLISTKNKQNSLFFNGNKLKPEANHFFDIFKIHVGVTFDYIDKLAINDLRQYLQVDKHTEMIYKRLYNRMIDWVMQPTGEFLRKSDIVKFIDDIKNNISNKLVACHELHVDNLRSFDLRFVGDEFEKFSRSLPTTTLVLNLVARCSVDITAIKVMQSLKNVRFSFITATQLDYYPKDILLDDMRLCGSLYLVIVCEENLENVQAALTEFTKTKSEKITNKKFIVITKEPLNTKTCPNFEVSEDQVEFGDLDDVTQKNILDKKVTFRGAEMKVASVFFEKIRHIIRNEVLYELIVASEIKVKKLLVSEDERKRVMEENTCYIERTLKLRNELQQDVLLQPFMDDILVVSNITENELRVLYLELSMASNSESVRKSTYEESMQIIQSMRQDNHSISGETKPDRIIGKRILVLKTNDPETEFDQICTSNQTKNVSWIEYDGSGRFFWKKTQGTVQNLRKYIDQTTSLQFSIDRLSNIERNVVLISGAPGTGKSALLSHLLLMSVEQNPNTWVIKFDLVAYTNKYVEESFLTKNVLDFLMMTQKFDNEFERILFKAYFEERKVVVLIDGFDEIAPSHREVVTEFIRKLIDAHKNTVWVTTRPHEQKHLEDRLGMLAYSLDPFDESDKKSFFMKRWSGRDGTADLDNARLNVFVEKLMDVFNRSICGVDSELLAVPLQCKMFAEVFEEKLLDFCRSDQADPDLPRVIDVIQLYEKFLEKKCQIYATEKTIGLDMTVDAAKKMFKNCFKQFIETHKLLSLRLLFENDVLDELLTDDEKDDIKTSLTEIDNGEEVMGVVVSIADGKPIFIHRKVAEYCAALWFNVRAKTKDVSILEFISKNLFRVENESLKRFFDLLAVKKIPELRAVFNGDVETVKNTLERDGDKFYEKFDQFGRNVLHLIATYRYDDTSAKVIIAAGRKRLNEKDRFLEWSPLRYACMSLVWSNVDDLLQISDEDIDEYIDNKSDLIFQSVECDYSNIVRRLVATNSNLVCATNKTGQMPLHIAAPYGYLDICKSLIEAGAAINNWDNNNINVLHYVGASQIPETVDVIRYLMEKGARIDVVDENGFTPLYFAVSVGCFAICEMFIKECRADVNAKNKELSTPLHHMALSSFGNRKQIVEWLVEAGARVNDVNGDGFTPILYAVRDGNEEVCKYLVLEAKVDLKVSDRDGNTVLHHLAFSENKNCAEIVRVLIQAGAEANVANKYRTTPLHMFVMYLNREACKILIDEGHADVNAVNIEDVSVLHHIASVAEEDRSEIVQDLLEAGAEVDAIDRYGNTPLLTSALKGNMNLCRFFIRETKADVRACNNDKENILHCIASSPAQDTAEIAEEVIRVGADINGRDKYENTPLHLALMYGHLSLCRYLITETDADLTARNSRQVGMLHCIACRVIEDGDKIAQLLVEKGAILDIRTVDGETPLHLISFRGRLEVCKYLTMTPVDIGARDNEGLTALHYAAASKIPGRRAIIRQLVISGINIDEVDSKGKSALMIGLEHGNKNVCKYLIEMGADVCLKNARGASVWHYLVGGDFQGNEQFEIAELLRESVPVNTVDEDGVSPLILAEQLDQESMYEFLLTVAKIQADNPLLSNE